MVETGLLDAAAERRDTVVVPTNVPWWVYVIMGIAWTWFAFIVLSFDFRTVWAVAVFAGVSFVVAGVNEIVVARSETRWRWAHVALAVLFVGAGVICLVWPEITFVALAAIVGWFLLLQGSLDVGLALMDRQGMWWLRLILGVLQIAVAVWAISYPGNSFVLLAVWVAAAALLRGFGHFLLAMAVRDLAKHPAARLDSGAMVLGGSPSDGGAPGGGNDDDVVEEFRRSHGHVSGPFEGQSMLLLHSKDAKTGRDVVSPLMYRAQDDGDRLVVVGTDARGNEHPDWYHNLMVHPHATVEIGDEQFEVDAGVAQADEDERSWGRTQADVTAASDRWRSSGGWTIPVVVLYRSSHLSV